MSAGKRSRRRLHLGEPCYCACEMYEGGEGGQGFLTSQGDSTEAFDAIEEALDEVAFFVECPVDFAPHGTGRVLLDVGRGFEVVADEGPQMVGVIRGVGDDMAHTRHALDQPARLRAVAPLPGRDDDAERQAEGIHGGMDFGGQPAFRPPDAGSFKPPF